MVMWRWDSSSARASPLGPNDVGQLPFGIQAGVLGTLDPVRGVDQELFQASSLLQQDDFSLLQGLELIGEGLLAQRELGTLPRAEALQLLRSLQLYLQLVLPLDA